MENWDKTRIQAGLSVASFTCGVLIGCVCLFFIPPYGEIHSSAISIVSELLVLCGALLGIKTGFDAKMKKFEGELRATREKLESNSIIEE